jgi:putative acetyltransferase
METRELVVIRPIRPGDDPLAARIVRDALAEFGCSGGAFAPDDPELQALSAAYPGGAARFFVVELGGALAGCGGFGPLRNAPASERVCELRKMYFVPALRGRGLGRRFLGLLLDEMRAAGYERCYLETSSRMDRARELYRRAGFAELERPLGGCAQSACDRFFARPLRDPGA